MDEFLLMLIAEDICGQWLSFLVCRYRHRSDV